MNTINYILHNPLTPQGKILIRNMGRPELPPSYKNKLELGFFNNIYENFPWMWLCEETRKLHCFPCTLINQNDPFSCSIVTLQPDKIKEHEISLEHLLNEALINELEREIEPKGNPLLDKKLCELITSLQSHVVFERVMNQNDESSSIDILKEINSECLRFEQVYQSRTKLFKSIEQVHQNTVCSEVGRARFVTVQINEATDWLHCSQFVATFRYVLDGELHEKFWGFVRPQRNSKATLGAEILRLLHDSGLGNFPDKLIAMSFDYGPQSSYAIEDIKKLVKKKYRYVKFTHSDVMDFKEIIKKCSGQSVSAREFFARLEAIPKYFAKFRPVLSASGHEGISPKEWDFSSENLLQTIHRNQKTIEYYLSELCKVELDNGSLRDTLNLLHTLRDPDFAFWLNFFVQLFPFCREIYSGLQSEETSVEQISMLHGTLIKKMVDIKNNLNNDPEPLTKTPAPTLLHNARETCNQVMKHISDILLFKTYFYLELLFKNKSFPKYRNEFPSSFLKNFSCASATSSGLKVDPKNNRDLTNQLKAVYWTDTFGGYGPLKLLRFFYRNNLHKAFRDVVNLLEYLCTFFPILTCDKDRISNKMMLVKRYLRSVVANTGKGVWALAILAVERKDSGAARERFSAAVANYMAEYEKSGTFPKIESVLVSECIDNPCQVVVEKKRSRGRPKKNPSEDGEVSSVAKKKRVENINSAEDASDVCKINEIDKPSESVEDCVFDNSFTDEDDVNSREFSFVKVENIDISEFGVVKSETKSEPEEVCASDLVTGTDGLADIGPELYQSTGPPYWDF